MKKRNRFVTLVLVLLCIAGGVVGAAFLTKEQKLEQTRQRQVAALSARLEPLSDQRRKWEEKEKQWQRQLEEQKTGRPCVLLNFDNMGDNLCETIYDLMDQYGFRGTFSLRNGRLPGDRRADISKSEFEDLLFDGWEYALSFGEEWEQEEEIGYWERKELEESESETEAKAKKNDSEPEEEQSFLEQLDGAVERLEKKGMSVPEIVFCDSEQYGEVSDAALARRGFKMVCVKDDEELPVIGERGSRIWRIDCGVYMQKSAEAEIQIQEAVEKGQSLAIFINDVHKVSQDVDYDLSLTRFTSLLNCLKKLEEEGEIYVITYSELDQYEEQQRKQYEDLLRQYQAFREERAEAESGLNQKETEIVEALLEPEAEAEKDETFSLETYLDFTWWKEQIAKIRALPFWNRDGEE